MKIILENTSKIVEVNGVPGRIWEGKTGNGIAVSCVITRIAVEAGSDNEQFERELIETPAPAPMMGVSAFPARMVI